MCRDHGRLSGMVMPESMVSLAVVSRAPSRWYSLYDGGFFLEMCRALHFGTRRLIARV